MYPQIHQGDTRNPLIILLHGRVDMVLRYGAAAGAAAQSQRMRSFDASVASSSEVRPVILDASVALGRHAALSCVVASDTACVCQVSAEALEQVVRANPDLSEQVLALALRSSSRHAEVGGQVSQGMVQPDTPTKLSRQRTAPSNKIGSGAGREPAEVVHSKEAAVQLRQEIEDALVDGVVDAREQLLIDAKQAELFANIGEVYTLVAQAHDLSMGCSDPCEMSSHKLRQGEANDVQPRCCHQRPQLLQFLQRSAPGQGGLVSLAYRSLGHEP